MRATWLERAFGGLVVTSGIDWPHLVFSAGAGLGVLLIGIGILVVCSAVANVLRRLNVTLDEVDRQIAALGAPVAETLGHVGGIADTADTTVARLGELVGSLELVAANVVKTSDLTGRAVSPALVNIGSTLTGITAGVRRLITGRRSRGGLGGETLLDDGITRPSAGPVVPAGLGADDLL